MAPPREQAFLATPFALPSTRVIASPFQFATTEDDNLRIESANSLTGVVLAIQGRRLTPAGAIEPFAFVHTPNTDRSVRTQDYKLGAGALLNLTIFASSGTPRIGQTYVTARFIRGLTGATIVLGTLLAGYVTAAQHLAYPGSPIVDSISGGGCAREVTGTNPAPGSLVSEAVPSGARWRVRSILVTFTTSATVATRQVFVTFDSSGGTRQAYIAQTANQPESTGWTYTFLNNLPLIVTAIPSIVTAGLPDMPLLAGATIGVSAQGIRADDDFSAPFLVVEEWLEVSA